MEPTVANRYEKLCGELRSWIESEKFMARHCQRDCGFTRERQLTFRMLISNHF
jgi:hypothetical protein